MFSKLCVCFQRIFDAETAAAALRVRAAAAEEEADALRFDFRTSSIEVAELTVELEEANAAHAAEIGPSLHKSPQVRIHHECEADEPS